MHHWRKKREKWSFLDAEKEKKLKENSFPLFFFWGEKLTVVKTQRKIRERARTSSPSPLVEVFPCRLEAAAIKGREGEEKRGRDSLVEKKDGRKEEKGEDERMVIFLFVFFPLPPPREVPLPKDFFLHTNLFFF